MPFIVTAVLSAAVARLRGGHLSNLAQLTIRGPLLPLLALALQILALYGPGRQDARPFSFWAWLILGSYGLLFVTVAINRRLPGMVWLGLGAFSNLVVMLANGGWMPVTAERLAQAGLIGTSEAVTVGQRVWATKDVVMLPQEIRLCWLSDLFVIPKAGLFSAVFSLGDALMMAGLFWLLQVGMVNEVCDNES